MKIEHIVTNFELSKKLKELGLPQDEGLFWWAPDGYQEYSLLIKKQTLDDFPGYYPCEIKQLLEYVCAAPTADELKRFIPDGLPIKDNYYYFNISLQKADGDSFCKVIIEDSDKNRIEDGVAYDTLADALASLLIWLVGSGYVKFRM